MISDFSFDSSVSKFDSSVAPDFEKPLGLQLPIRVPTALLNLSRVGESLHAFVNHFAPLALTWVFEKDSVRGGKRVTGVVSTDRQTGGVWSFVALERASTGSHRHNSGGLYGELLITLAGELQDEMDDGTAVTLNRGAVLFHAADTAHNAKARRYWAGITHQPRGVTRTS
jgi:hypothetical protein